MGKSVPCSTTAILLNVFNRYMSSSGSFSKNCTNAGTIQDVKEALAKAVAADKSYNPFTTNRINLDKYLPKTQNELPTRTISDSFSSALIPLSKDIELQNKYVTFLGHVRIGRLLEDMDLFAVYVAQKHLLITTQPKDEQSPYTLVTALVDKMDFMDFIPKANEDIKLSGHVSWVGRSSMEVTVWLEQNSHGTWQNITKGLFLIAARDSLCKKSAIVNALEASNDEEKNIIASGIERRRKRKLNQCLHLTKVIPNEEEQKLIHELFLRTVDFDEISLKKRNLPQNCAWMNENTLSNLIFSHPEDRNIHYKVFGGYLMRHALELSWGLGYLFSKYRPIIRTISNITFNRPVEVGSLIRMNAAIVYTYKQFFQVTVYAEMWDSSTGQSSTTNSFHFTYEVPEIVKEVFPCTYHEAMMHIDGRRQFYNVMFDKSSPNLKPSFPM